MAQSGVRVQRVRAAPPLRGAGSGRMASHASGGGTMNNLRASLLMVAAMAGFAIEDVIIKQLSATLGLPQLLILLGLVGGVVLALICAWRGEGIFHRGFFGRAVLARNLGEMIGSVGFCTALALVPISVASAILQALPLTVTLGAALFLGESVGWRRWAAIVAGLAAGQSHMTHAAAKSLITLR
ncbi:MAG: hypothetical protein FJX19_04170, partial [Alphaproteobacteria bacterium]|nr:hypothetical protein [Alphaproteobacteria bacterium]